MFIMVTSFTRMVIVLSFLRQALGTQQVPPNQVLISLALFLTMFVMAPVGEAVYKDALKPPLAEQIGYDEAWNPGILPIRAFMLKQMRDKDLELFLELSHSPKPTQVEQVPTHVIIPAFVLSELRISFQIGFLLYIPFLIVDMVVASVLMSMGMMLLPPVMISLPFKLILFVLADGWYLVVGSIVRASNRSCVHDSRNGHGNRPPAIETAMLVSAPILGLSLIVGLLVSTFQAMTQINEATLTFVPKVLAVFAATLLFLPWMMGVLIAFMTHIITSIPSLIHS